MRYEKNGFVFENVKHGKHGSIWRVTLGGLFFAHVDTSAVIRALKA